ncbi:MAG: ribose 5-phosphate isomerase B [Ignavibacteria bacterium]|jgi:RpiB/LacA/LacB family sugar-phosphate isomerase|nr:ribose 5-phosphate isomerase B [Ignavibacteria bacterium]
MKKIIIGNDHAGYNLKQNVIQALQKHNIIDCGCYSNASVDYPDFAKDVALKVATDADAIGILICGTGTGMAIAANKIRGIRAANCYNVELAQLARQHNDANILCLGARFVPNDIAIQIVHCFINTDFEAGRHLNRINKIENNKYEHQS